MKYPTFFQNTWVISFKIHAYLSFNWFSGKVGQGETSCDQSQDNESKSQIQAQENLKLNESLSDTPRKKKKKKGNFIMKSSKLGIRINNYIISYIPRYSLSLSL